MSGRGHRRLRLCNRKNYERRKYSSAAVMTVSVPLHLLRPQVPSPLLVSLPISALQEAPITSLDVLRSRLKSVGELSSGAYGHILIMYFIHVCIVVQDYVLVYVYTITDWREQWQNGELTLYQVSPDGPSVEITFTLRVQPNLSYSLYFRGTVVDSHKCGVLANSPCVGNCDQQFLSLPNIHKGVFREHSGMFTKIPCICFDIT